MKIDEILRIFEEGKFGTLSEEEREAILAECQNIFGDVLVEYILSAFDEEPFTTGAQQNFAEMANMVMSKIVSHLAKPGARLLEVASGESMSIAKLLADKGFKVTAVDRQIKMTECIKKLNPNIKPVSKEFICDYLIRTLPTFFRKGSKGFDVSKFELVYALKPCEASEHIIRQCEENDVPYIILMCRCANLPITDVRNFCSVPEWIRPYTPAEDWYEYLKSIAPKSEQISVRHKYKEITFFTNIKSSKEVIGFLGSELQKLMAMMIEEDERDY